MPIKIPDQLPAHEVLVREGVSVMDERTALRQDIRPLQIGLLNLMPNKMRTETQFARLIGATPLQVELTLVRIGNHKAKNTSEDHLIAFYQTWEEVAAAQVRRLHRHGRADRAPAFRRGHLLGRADAHLRLDDLACPLLLLHLLGGDGRRLAFPSHSQIHARKKGLRRLPSPQQRTRLALSCRLLGRFRHSCFALDGGAGRRHSRRVGPGAADGVGRDRAVPCSPKGPATGSICSTTSNTTRRRSRKNMTATWPPARRSKCRTDIIPKTIPAGRRSIAGARTPIYSSATGSTRSTRPRPSTSRGSVPLAP